MNPNDPVQEEAQDASLLGMLKSDPAPLDTDVLARLRTQSSEAYLAASSPPAPNNKKKNPMLFTQARWLGALAAAVIFGVGVYSWLSPGVSGLALGEALEELDGAETLHVRMKRNGTEMEYWHTSQPNRSRWDDLAGNYRITDGDTDWIVNENANQARRRPAGSQTLQPAAYLLDLLGVSSESAHVRSARPVERIFEQDGELLVYRLEFGAEQGTIDLEARVDATTHRLRAIRTRIQKAGKNDFLTELTLIAYGEPIGVEKFAVADTLTDDGRIGKVADVQGIVTLKPVLSERWTPVRQNLVLRPGDWVRTDARGANATTLHLVKQTAIILGPKTLVELVGPRQFRVIEGEVEVTPGTGSAIELLAPAGQRVTIKEKQMFAVRKEVLARLTSEPSWLRGFKGATTNESLGSLVALVDGRNVPLTVGYHKVSVDIRDQIARTVVEESFVNHTTGELEGVFYFPLPQDASISGFGMWIGDNLVEADVVEKQRAREIYETILRERRDPGLLEWSGGNLFKARVFPIAARSEKRIRITYTQVLPLKGSRYRFGYALQSDLLREHPLRELAIDVKINSAVPLKSVTSPTHTTRDELTVHSAHVEFSAQEYTPTQDFEVVVELGSRKSDVVLVPHRRGDDGYFMLQLTPPGGLGDWGRALLPDGEPLHLLILADTSASIDASARAAQTTFIGSLLAVLSPRDTFNLATCDVTCEWVFEKPTPPSAQNVAQARDFLAARSSLGWTDLDVAFTAALKQCGPKTHVIYVGDGIITAGDGDPVAFSKRLQRMVQGQPGTFHSVSLGSTYESGVLKAIAAVGGGSMRKITGEQGPQAIALELLGEIAQPALRDLAIEFKGFKAARVYPETIANVPSGSQQILLGRYLPEGKDQSGEIIVTGTQGGKPVRLSTQVSFKDAEEGNAFIPRLWARMYLDSLLDQGASGVIKDEIIALSEEYKIITPYTSFLVLETDADRERFKVKRRFQMRDGERFFAEGRDNASFELSQKQMKRAARWRTALRTSVLSELARLGREPRLFQPYERGRGSASVYWGLKKRQAAEFHLDELGEEEMLPASGPSSGLVPLAASLGLGDRDDDPLMNERKVTRKDLALLDGEMEEITPSLQEELAREDDASREWMPREEASAMGANEDMSLLRFGRSGGAGRGGDFNYLLNESTEFDYRRIRRSTPRYGQWLNVLFPPLPAAAGKTVATKSNWPKEARDLAKSVLRNEVFAKMKGGLEIVRQADSFEARWNQLTARSLGLELVSARSWLTRTATHGEQTLVSWCDDREVGIYSRAFQLGRKRVATADDPHSPPLEVNDYSLASIEVAFATYSATVERQGKNRATLVLAYMPSGGYETRIAIDTERQVVLSIENSLEKKVTQIIRFEDFVQAAGLWWAQKIETTDAALNRTTLVTQKVKDLSAKELEQRISAELADRVKVQFVQLPLPSVAQAKKALASDKAGFEEQFALLLHFLHSQQWERVFDHLQRAEEIAKDKPGLRWVRSALLNDGRRHEELRRRNLVEAVRLAKADATVADVYFLAQYLLGQSKDIVQANEMLALVEAVRPLYEKQPAHVQGPKTWQHLRATYVSRSGQPEKALPILKQLAADDPHDYQLQREYAQALAGAGDYPAAYAWLKPLFVKDAKWLPYEEETLRNTYSELLQAQGRYDVLAQFLAEWVKENPPNRAAYEQYLVALIKSDQTHKAEELALRWLKDAQVPGAWTPPVEARMNAAVALMLGHANQLYTNRVEERWLKPLAEAALYFATRPVHLNAAGQILSNHPFQRSDVARPVFRTLAAYLAEGIEKLPPEQILRLVEWVPYEELKPVAWDKLIVALRKRWTAETDVNVKHDLGRVLVRLLPRRDGPDEPLAFLRLQLQTAPPKYRVEYANELFNHLLEAPWLSEHEKQAMELLDKLSADDDPGTRLLSEVAALHRLTDRFLESRFAFRMKSVEHAEKLTRTDLRKKKAEYQKWAREGVADLLRAETEKKAKALRPWLIVETLYLDVLLERDLKNIASEAWKYLEAAPVQRAKDSGLEAALDQILSQRYLVTLMNLAARKGGPPALVDQLLGYLDKHLKENPDDGRWKRATYRLLIALDRSKELEQALKRWIHQDDPDNGWHVALGYLLAEQGRLAAAIQQMEAVESSDELTPSDYRTLSEWYLAQNRRDLFERAARAVYRTMPEYQLSRHIALKLQPWQLGQGRVPTELDIEVLRMFAVLFDKSVEPQRYLYQLQQFYQAAHDFRLLSGLPDAVIGHSAERVYPFLQGMDSVLQEVRDEATADEIVKRISEVRPRARSGVDQRALDLLEVLVERRAAEVQNQAGPHRDKALAALQRAFKRSWGTGEPRLMADFLAGLGQITQASLAAEQIRELQSLHAAAGTGTGERLHIAYRYASVLHGRGRAMEAVDLLEVALKEFEAANNGVLPVTANDALATYARFLEGSGHFARGEKVLLAQLEHPAHPQQRRWLIERLDQLYHHALQNDGEVSLGKKDTLYEALQRKLQKELSDPDRNHQYEILLLMCKVHRTADEKKNPRAASEVRAFAREMAPPYLKQQTNHYDALVNTVALTVHDIAGPREGILFLLDQMEQEPGWLRYSNQDGWSRHSYSLAHWRLEANKVPAKDADGLEKRLLERVLLELRRDLESREARSRVIYAESHDRERYWREKAPYFAKLAEAVLAERSDSATSVPYIADYLFWGLGRRERAIEVLFIAYKKKVLEEEGEAKLVDLLHMEGRFKESIGVLQPLVERRPENLQYHVQLMHAYFRTAKKGELLALLKQTDAYFHEKDRWNERPLSILAQSTLQNELYERSVAYYKELIALHERTHGGRGVGNGTLASYYSGLASAYAGLKKTPEAVDAAGAAIVAWGTRQELRQQGLNILMQVLLGSPDLDAYVAHLDRQKQDSAIVRKAIGEAYHQKKEQAKAIKQLELAAALQPNDAQIYALLIACYDEVGDKEGAVRQLLHAVQHVRRDAKLYEDLGRRYSEIEQSKEGERAYTSMVEMLPGEAASHAQLAEVREKQDRWREAIEQWELAASLQAYEPTALLRLAAAQIHEKQMEAAGKTLIRLGERSWPTRFGNVPQQLRELQSKIPEKKK